MTSFVERHWKKIYQDPMSGCWIWIGARKSRDYGVVRIAKRLMLAHRVSYEAAKGSIIRGLGCDHLCRVHPCVNPAHLEPVPQAVNVRRGDRMRRTTHCKRGHLKSPDNLYERACRTCALAASAARYARRMGRAS